MPILQDSLLKILSRQQSENLAQNFTAVIYFIYTEPQQVVSGNHPVLVLQARGYW